MAEAGIKLEESWKEALSPNPFSSRKSSAAR